MKKYFTSALLLGVFLSISTASAQLSTSLQASPVVDTVADQVDCTALRYALSLGSKDSRTGGDVTNLQVYLSQTGYLEADPTGYFGNATKKAVQAFQRANGIAPQGNVGPYTRAKIKELSCNGPVAQQPVPTTPTNPVMCTMEMVRCPDGSYSGRSGPNCEFNCPKPIIATTSPTVEFLTAPTLKLQYDSVGKESILEGKAVIKITAGLQAINIGYNVVNGQVAQLLQFNKDQGAISANSMRFSAVGNPACVWSNTAGCLIPAGSSMTFNVTNTVNASQLFAGSYSMRPAGFTYYDTNTISHMVQPQDFKGNSTSNSVMVVGETTPYISSVSPMTDFYGGLIGYSIGGNRFSSLYNYVTINGVTKTISSSPSDKSPFVITFNPSDFNLVSGNYYTVQVSTNEGASNLSGFTFSGATQPASRVITVFGNKDPNPTTGATTIIWNTSKPVNASLDMVCTPGSISFTTNRGNNPICEKGGIWNALGQNSDSILITPSGNTTPITIPFTLTVSDTNGVTLDKETISITFPATSQNNANNSIVISSATIKEISPTQINVDLTGTGFKKAVAMYVNNCLSGSALSFSSNSDIMTGTGYASNYFPQCATSGSNARVYLKDANGVSSNVMSIYVPYFNFAQTATTTATISASPTSVTSGQSTTVSWSSTNAAYCTVTTGSFDDYGPGSAPLTGSKVVGPLTASRTATITCPGKNGTTATHSITIPVSTTPISVNASLTPSPASQFVIGGSMFGIANYNLSVQGGAGTLRSLTFTTTGTDAIGDFTVGGVTTAFIGGKATISGLNLAVPSTGLNLPVTVTFSGIMNSTVGGTLTSGVPNVGITLTSAEVVSNGSVVVSPLNVSSNKMTLVASKPSLTMSSLGASSLFLGKEKKIGEFTVSADANGPIAIGGVALNVSSSNIQNLQISSLRIADGPTTITNATVSMSGNSISVGFGNSPWQISAGQPKTFSVYGTVSGTPQSTIVPMYLSTSLVSSGFNWSDRAGGNISYNGTNIYNFPTNSYSITGMGPIPTPIVTIPAPTATISASPASVTSGQSTTVSWSATNVNYCTVTTGSIDDYGAGAAPLTGSKVLGSFTVPRTATITCPGKNGTTATQTITIPVTAPVITIPAPTATISAFPASVTSGQSTTVSWTALNVNYCTVTSGSINDYAAGSAPLVGSLVVEPLTAARTVTITCPGKNGTTATQSITIPVTAPTPAPVAVTPTITSLAFLSGMIGVGSTADITFSSQNTNYCHLYMTPPGAPEMTLTEGYFSSKIVTTAPLMTAGNYNVVLYCWDASGAATSKTMTFTVKSAALQNKINSITGNVLGAFTSNASCTDIPRNLIRGSESSYVTLLQDFLYNNGFLNETSTGFYGDKTVEAVKDYQATRGLPTTGMVYDFTRQAIFTDTCQ